MPSRTAASVLHLKVREQGLYHFMTLSASFAMTPGESSPGPRTSTGSIRST